MSQTLANPRVRAARRAAMTRRLIALHDQCSAADLAAGRAWYDRAQSAARDMAVDGDVARAAAVIAHLSPRESWSRNVANAARVLSAVADGGDCPAVHTMVQRVKAWQAATGTVAPDANHGPKTSAFLANILGDDRRVCVDSWAARAATGDMAHEGPSGVAQYRVMEEAYVRAADAVGISPRDLQAAIWVHVRGDAD